jgi:hypothetical protein
MPPSWSTSLAQLKSPKIGAWKSASSITLTGKDVTAGSMAASVRQPARGRWTTTPLLSVAAGAQKLSPFLVDSDPKHIPIHLKPLTNQSCRRFNHLQVIHRRFVPRINDPRDEMSELRYFLDIYLKLLKLLVR